MDQRSSLRDTIDASALSPFRLNPLYQIVCGMTFLFFGLTLQKYIGLDQNPRVVHGPPWHSSGYANGWEVQQFLLQLLHPSQFIMRSCILSFNFDHQLKINKELFTIKIIPLEISAEYDSSGIILWHITYILLVKLMVKIKF